MKKIIIITALVLLSVGLFAGVFFVAKQEQTADETHTITILKDLKSRKEVMRYFPSESLNAGDNRK